MKTMRLCPKCSKPLAPDALLGLCPECMMKAGLETEAQPTNVPKPAAPAFDVADVAKHFPQLEILELLGQGGMGVVFKARQPQLDRLVALKLMLPEFAKDPAFAERFTREARALARLSHPNIVAVYDFGQTGRGGIFAASSGQPGGDKNVAAPSFFYFIMEYVDGANLREMLHGGHLTPEQAFAIVPKLCDALQFAHDEGIMHRDIKPENILIDKKGRVKIADFGLAKILGQETAGEAITVTGMGMGTPKYMAPEQIENAKTVDHRADIYSLGVVFYEMLTGELPLGRFAPPSQKVQVDVRLDEVVLHTLEKEPGRRYQHASEVKTAVEHISSTARDVPGLPPTEESQAAPAFSRKAIWGAIWVVGIPLAAIGWQGLLRPVYEGGAPAEQWRMILGWLGVFLGLTGSIGTTLLGFMAIHDIRHSRGRIVGLPLAFADAILFPLGAIGLGIGWIVQETLAATFDVRPTRMEGPAGLVALVVCFFSARAIWHALAGREKPSQPAGLPAASPLAPVPAVEKPGHWLGHLSLWTAIGGVMLPVFLAIGGAVFGRFRQLTDGFILLCWALGVVLELVALGCGIVARRTATGKAGLIISSILLLLYVLVYLAVFALVPVRKSSRSEPVVESSEAQPQTGAVLRSFAVSDPTISTNLVGEGGGWFANCAEAQTLRLFEVPNPGVDGGPIVYSAQLNTKDLKGRAYLEMWCRLPGPSGGEFFARGLEQIVTGGYPWADTRTTFFFSPGQRPDLIRLNVVVEGTGRIGIRTVEMRRLPPSQMR